MTSCPLENCYREIEFLGICRMAQRIYEEICGLDLARVARRMGALRWQCSVRSENGWFCDCGAVCLQEFLEYASEGLESASCSSANQTVTGG